MAPVYGQEIESIGDPSSVQLMRDSILRSICRSNSSVETRYGLREEMSSPSHPSIEVKFLEKRCSSFSSPKSKSEEAEPPEENPKAESSGKTESFYPPLPDFEISGSFEASGELYKEKNDTETGEGLQKIVEGVEDSPRKPGNSSKNSLKLAIRSKSDGIFEDCSTYNISFPDASPESKGNEIFTNSIAGSYSTDLEHSSETDYSDSELALSKTADSPDDQTSLCDTFFTHFVDNENGQQPPHLSQANRKTSEPQARSDQEGAKESEGDSQGRGRSSKKTRRRDRKSHTNDPFVYECPKCGVSYVIASKMTNDGVCLHCDLWTSVEPEFVKREKLLTWNTCRIC
ncbi:unnamed protein product [Larinioides sclopetarius]|uniref:Uncharacterized protein n=1 Tax=Larinioides sclopetarius TaxID=280406 RepID=A0AAV2B500_9ARAC